MGCLGTPCDWTCQVAISFITTTTMSPCMLSGLTGGKRPPQGSQYLFLSSKPIFPPKFIMAMQVMINGGDKTLQN